MKTTKPSAKRQPKLTLQLSSWGSYLDEAAELEDLLRKKPARLRIELSGVGEMPSDTALLIRSILLARSPRTHVTTHARSSLQGGAVLVWLLGDQRLIRDDARLHFRAAGPFENNDSGMPWVEPDTLTDDEFENADYIRVLQLINEFLPVRELAGRSIELPTLRQFGNSAIRQFGNSASWTTRRPTKSSPLCSPGKSALPSSLPRSQRRNAFAAGLG